MCTFFSADVVWPHDAWPPTQEEVQVQDGQEWHGRGFGGFARGTAQRQASVLSVARRSARRQASSKADASNLNQTISDFQPTVSKCLNGDGPRNGSG